MELAHEVLVEHAHLAVENQRGRFQSGNSGGQIRKAFRVFTPLRLINRTRGPSL